MIGFSRHPDGVVVARFTADEAAVLRDLAGQLIVMLSDRVAAVEPVDAALAAAGIGGSSSPPVDPALRRLLPDAYRDDADAAAEHRRLTERGLVDRKAANARALIDSLPLTAATVPVRLDAAGVDAWLRCLTDLRLAIAARLGIKREGDADRLTGDDAALAGVIDWLGAVQGMLLECLDA